MTMKTILAVALFGLCAGCAHYTHQSPGGDRTSFTSFLMLGQAGNVRSATSETNGYRREVEVGSLYGRTETEKLNGLLEAVSRGVAAGLKP